MSSTALAETLELTDPRAMRALAHPVRLSILEVLHANGTANATECAREIGESPQACSYHLRALAKWGFIRQVDSDDARETRWAPAARNVQFSSVADDSPEFQAAASLLQRQVLERDNRIVAEYLRREDEFSDDWRDAATFSSGFIVVSPDELRELNKQFAELLRAYGSDRAERPEDARRVDVILRALPKVEQ
jgi:DNA-binding transcriptional ArsR family regulator